MISAQLQSEAIGSKRDLGEMELARVSSHKDQISAQEDPEVAAEDNETTTVTVSQSRDIEPPANAVEDSRPTRRYQKLLLICGFLMIFQVIGINSIYGVFQVSDYQYAQFGKVRF